MNNDECQMVLERWEAMFGVAVPKGAVSSWKLYLSNLTSINALPAICGIIDKLSEKYDATDNFSKPPGLGVIKKAYRSAKMQKMDPRKFHGCSLCNSTGVNYMVVGYDLESHRQRPIPAFTLIPAPWCYVYSVPCTCDRGRMVNESYNLPGRQRSYTPQQLESLAVRFIYSFPNTPKDTMPNWLAYEWLHKCQQAYKDGNHDQQVGFYGDKQVAGFLSERTYEPA